MIWDWQPAHRSRWTDPQGQQLGFGTAMTGLFEEELLLEVRQGIEANLWQRVAQTHQSGKGASEGVDWSELAAPLKHLDKEAPEQAAMLRLCSQWGYLDAPKGDRQQAMTAMGDASVDSQAHYATRFGAAR